MCQWILIVIEYLANPSEYKIILELSTVIYLYKVISKESYYILKPQSVNSWDLNVHKNKLLKQNQNRFTYSGATMSQILEQHGGE